MFLTIGTIVSGRYEIKEKLGSGGMANVYKALDIKLDRDITFKVMREEYAKDDEFVQRFYVEARAAARLSHPNIVNVHDVGQDGDIYYIVMEYIEGFTLKELIIDEEPISDSEILGVAIQIASALQHSHSHNIIHRDIKPENILITTNGKIKVTDFGIARASSTSTVTNTNNTMGSAHYFSPEQARGRFIDARSDIYSLGIVMYEMAAKTLPFDGDTPVAVALKHLNDPIPDIRPYNPNINESLEKIIFKAAEKISSNRYDSAESMSNDLKRALTNSSGDFVQDNSSYSSNTVVFSEDDVSIIKGHRKPEPEQDDDFYEYEEEDYTVWDDEKIDSRTEKRIVIAAVASAFAVILLISAVIISFYISNRPEMVTVPNLIGRNIDEVTQEMSAQNISIIMLFEEYRDDYDTGTIIYQTYVEGVTIESGSQIEVIVSSGRRTVQVPNLTGIMINDAISALTELGLHHEENYIYSAEVDILTIINQDPIGNSDVEIGSTVTLYISQGAELETVIAPSLTGLTEADAIATIERSGMTLGHISRAESSTVELGRVITQSANFGREVTRGSAMAITISTGTPISTVDDEENLGTEAEVAQPTEPEPIPEPTPEPEPAPEPEPTPEPEPAPIPEPTPEPEPAPIPEPTPEPEPTPIPEPTPEPDLEVNEPESPQQIVVQPSTRILNIDPVFVEGVESVTVRVNQRTTTGFTTIHEREYSVSEFPISIPVTGVGRVDYQMYIDDRHVATESIDFSM